MFATASHSLFASPALRSWQDARVFAGPATRPEGQQDYSNTLELAEGPGG